MSGLREVNIGENVNATASTMKRTYKLPEQLSDESSLDGNYLENYSTESDYSDGKICQSDLQDSSSGDDFFNSSKSVNVPLFPSKNDEETVSCGPESSDSRLNQYFAKLRKTDSSSFRSDAFSKPNASGDLALLGFKKTHADNLHQNSASGEASSSRRVKPPDPGNVPDVVIRLTSIRDVLQNRKVLAYLNQLEAAETDVRRRLEAQEKVAAYEISDLQASRDAILKKFGYDFTDKDEMMRIQRRARRRQMRKNEFPRGESVSSSSETDDSEKPLKGEVAKRYLSSGHHDISRLDFSDLMKHSKRWRACAEEEMIGLNGKLETRRKLTDKCRIKRK